MNEVKYISHSLGNGRITMLNICNQVKVVGDKLHFTTYRDGQQIKTESEINNTYNKVISCKDIDIKGSLYYWYRKNQECRNFKLIHDDSITECEVYKGNCWAYGLMLKKCGNELRFRIMGINE